MIFKFCYLKQKNISIVSNTFNFVILNMQYGKLKLKMTKKRKRLIILKQNKKKSKSNKLNRRVAI